MNDYITGIDAFVGRLLIILIILQLNMIYRSINRQTEWLKDQDNIDNIGEN